MEPSRTYIVKCDRLQLREIICGGLRRNYGIAQAVQDPQHMHELLTNSAFNPLNSVIVYNLSETEYIPQNVSGNQCRIVQVEPTTAIRYWRDLAGERVPMVLMYQYQNPSKSLDQVLIESGADSVVTGLFNAGSLNLGIDEAIKMRHKKMPPAPKTVPRIVKPAAPEYVITQIKTNLDR